MEDYQTQPNPAIPYSDQRLDSYNYELPMGSIAQNPVVPRHNSRLLVVNSQTEHSHHIFWELPQLLKKGDLLVMNNTRVIRARLYGYKTTGAPVEVLLLEEVEHNHWLSLVKPGKRLKIGAKILFNSLENSCNSNLSATVVATDKATGGRILKFELPKDQSVIQYLQDYGHIPLPPYITESTAEPAQYQTIYAEKDGSVAAPTAGLHFTEELLQKLSFAGIETAFVTLNVGVGTFRPVETENVTEHQMHSELVEVPEITIEKINQTKQRGGRIIAVGTTVVRSLEGAAAAFEGQLKPFYGKTNLFIYPGYQWRVVEGLITNFHLPKSSLMMLVSALIGRERLLNLYQEAINQQYRFYSFGDAMLILPHANINKPETNG